MIAKKAYAQELKPFVDRINTWSKLAKIGSPEQFIKERNWELKAIGNTSLVKTTVSFSETGNKFVALVVNSQHSLYDWLVTIGDYTVIKEDQRDKGSIKYGDRVFNFCIEYDTKKNSYKLIVDDCNDVKLMYLLRRVVSKKCVLCPL